MAEGDDRDHQRICRLLREALVILDRLGLSTAAALVAQSLDAVDSDFAAASM